MNLARCLLKVAHMRALLLAGALAGLVLSSSALAQTLAVTLNGSTQPASGAYTFNFYRNSCDGDAGAAFQTFSLAWPLAITGNSNLFWSTSSDCAGQSDAGTGNGLSFTTITNSNGSQNYAAIQGTTLLGSILNNTTNQCATGASGSVFVCVTQTVAVNTGYTVNNQTATWFMTFNYNMNPPPSPGGDCNGPCANPGDSDVVVTWTYDNSSISADHFNIYYRQDPSAQPDVNNDCIPSSISGLSGPGFFGFDGGDGGSNDPGVCDGCAQNSDCGGNNLCVLDSDSIPYCGLNCGANSSVCTNGFACMEQLSVDGTTSGLVCVPPGNFCIAAGVDAGTQQDAGTTLPPPGICGACAQSADCGGNNLCVGDQNGVAYCGTDCYQDAGICSSGFSCQVKVAIGSGVSGYVCVPPGNLCYPASSLCGTCMFNSDCGGSNLCLPSDGGNYCGVDCSDAGQIVCPEGTFCGPVTNVVGQSGTQCALPAGESCYNPNAPLADAGSDGGIVYPDGGTIFDGGLPDFTGWNVATANGQYITSLLVNNLTIGVCYDFAVQAIAVDGTPGYASAIVAAAPFESQDWWRLYKTQGGADNGGWHCQAGGGGLTLAALAVVLLAGRLLARRRIASGGGTGD
jgi:hypothetical protein